MAQAMKADRHYPKVIIDGKELTGIISIEPYYHVNELITVTITVYPVNINQDEIHLGTK